MEHIVASRRLRKSILKNVKNSDLDELNRNYTFPYFEKNNIENDSKKKEIKILLKIKNRIFIKMLITVILIFSCLISKLVFYDNIKENKFIQILINEYKKDYQKEDVINKIEYVCKKNKKYISYIIPDKVVNYTKNIYYNRIKNAYLNFNIEKVYYKIKNNNSKIASVYVYNKVDSIENTDEVDKTEKKEDPYTESVNPISAVSSMDTDIQLIKSKNINMIIPVSGTITSNYGAREEILAGVGTFHTGVDIANALNTKIKSSTTGKVTKIEKNNKYWGNYIIITTNDVSFRYAHLNEINVVENQEVKQGEIIGKMGSTGYSTGSHLHFEISIDSRTVDPQKLIDIR
jgi:murein DD-endopeptidase MepM/ murein hydrolase activator NlpD